MLRKSLITIFGQRHVLIVYHVEGCSIYWKPCKQIMKHAFTLVNAQRQLFLLISEVHHMPLHQTKPSQQLPSLSLSPHQPPTPPTHGLEGEAELPGAWLTVLRANDSSRTAHCLIGHYLCCQHEAEMWALSIPAAPLFLSCLLPSKHFHPLTRTWLKPNAEARGPFMF